MDTQPSFSFEPRLLTPEQAAAYLAISPRKLRYFSKEEGGIPIVPIGRTVRYDVTDLDAWIERQKAKAVEYEQKKAAAWEAQERRQKEPPPTLTFRSG